MDVRGIEVTNQLRSAIRAKLLELGVRYDEELPDYILVMVVNKKSRQQMHEDLNLFLENNTAPFVDWLHDQVLKKLQKVTIPKKKAAREFVPMVIVKQEEERKKKRSISVVDEKSKEGIPRKSQSPIKSIQNFEDESLNTIDEAMQDESPPVRSPPHQPISTISKSLMIETPLLGPGKFEKHSSPVSSTSKRNFEKQTTLERSEKRFRTDTKVALDKEEIESADRKMKSSINKPRITSVVSVKTRLGVTSPRKKFEIHRERTEADVHRGKEQRSEKKTYVIANQRNNFRGRLFHDATKKSKEEVNKMRILSKEIDEKNINAISTKSKAECTGSIKDRLGAVPKLRKESQEESGRNSRNRIGSATIKFRALGRLGIPRPNREENFHDNNAKFDDDNTNVPVKSHIIAVNNTTDKGDNRNSKIIKKMKADEKEEEDDEEGKVLASKVIVTPRPLKPLQPVQKRATQSLLLRAVAEANQSVVKQKNPEPILKEKKPVLKRLRTSGTREIGQNLSVHLNATKRLVMEKIQVELTNPDTVENEEPEPYVPRSVTAEQMGVVMSLFQRGDDNQKFLVTLNGYNNNVPKTISDDDERLEMEVNEEDNLGLSNAPNDSLNHKHSSDNFQAIESEELETPDKVDDENNENHYNDNLSIEDLPKKRRKLSPIVYTRSPSPDDSKGTKVSSVKRGFGKRSPVAAVIISDTSKEKCRYWPNCTLGDKCGYLHPAVPCSAFPTCKFGNKCSYKHPKCKFGLSCTKLGCIFSHPSQQCKYHPYCTKPGCTYLHPQVHSISSADITRDKFTWRRTD